MSVGKVAALVFVVLVVSSYFLLGGDEFLHLRFYKELYASSPLKTAVIFCLVYILSVTCSLPASAALSLTGGAIFGPALGFGLSLLACTLGATLALLVTRYIMRDFVYNRFSSRLAVINKGVDEEGAFYLFSLRLVPVVPFWLLNLLLGLTSMSVRKFLLVTCAGMVPITAMLTYTGGKIGEIDTFSFKALFSPELLAVTCLLAVFPYAVRFTLRKLRQRQ